ncbi:major facilitator superfamily domain-containing protein 6 [Hydra vulgaris]|uniref:Major facilitator superfamily domain-containing protein 6 n=1 Tax=Hydra vulgaris TaxID=6087 RepID=A0ABM4CSV6_HYDVU
MPTTKIFKTKNVKMSLKSIFNSIFRKDLLLAKLTYFFWNGKTVFVSYLPVFLEDIGFSPSRVTLIFSLYIISQFMGSIFWAFIADRLSKYTVIVVALTISATIFTLPQPFITSSFKIPRHNVTFMPSYKSKMNNEVKASLFFIVMNMLSSFFEGGLHGKVDNFIVDYIVENSSIKAYGIQRLFGSIGNALFAVLIGIVIEKKFFCSISIYTPIYIFHATLIFLFLASFYKIVFWAGRKKYSIIKLRQRQDHVKVKYPNFISVLKRFDVFPFYLFVFANGLAYGANMGIGMIHLLKLNASPTLLGINLLLMQVSSLVFYPLSSKIICLFGGPLSITFVSSIVYCVRFLLMRFINNPWLILPLQLTQGINGALFWVATIEYTYTKSNKLIGNLMFGSLNAIYKGASRSLGVLIAGYLYENCGAQSCFFYLAATMSFFSLTNIVYILYIKQSNSIESSPKLVDQCNSPTNDHNAQLTESEWDDAFFSGLLIAKRRRRSSFVMNIVQRFSTHKPAVRALINQNGNDIISCGTFRSLLS